MSLRPPGTMLPPTVPGVFADTRARLLRDEQRPGPADSTPRFCLTATSAGAIDGERVTGRWQPWIGAVDLEFVTIDIDGSGYAVSIRRSGADVVSVADGDPLRIGVSERWTIGDYLDVATTGSITRILVQMWFRGVGGGGLVLAAPGGGGG